MTDFCPGHTCISEAELHVIRASLQGGLIAKARRGELKFRLPIGLVHDALEEFRAHPGHEQLTAFI